MQIVVKRIKNQGTHGEYPALQNVQTGKIYVDITLGEQRFLEADANGENRHGNFVAYNIPGAWHSFIGEPECPLRRDIQFVLVEAGSIEAKPANPPGYAGEPPAGLDYETWLAVNNID